MYFDYIISLFLSFFFFRPADDDDRERGGVTYRQVLPRLKGREGGEGGGMTKNRRVCVLQLMINQELHTHTQEEEEWQAKYKIKELLLLLLLADTHTHRHCVCVCDGKRFGASSFHDRPILFFL